ncbi:MAG: hypothetical protein NO482_03505 [Candidatus Methanomethylicia archaeon]|jgi:hypothetical protein|nr:hypothetical protein [Candidatus Methanomethylicia archaeon]
MDQSIEAIIATMLFLGAFAFSQYILLWAYSSVVSGEVEEIKTDIASMVSSSIVMENSCSHQKWASWNPSSTPEQFGVPQGTKIWINASYLCLNDAGEPILLDMRTSGAPLQGSGTCEYDRLVLLDDGNLVLLRVVIG